MFKAEILENENRRRIYSLIDATPGIHLRELQRDLDIPLTTLEYHLGYMVRKKIVFVETDARFKRYYSKSLDQEDRKVLSVLRQRRLREIVLVVMSSGKAKYQYLATYFDLPNSTLSFYLRHLVENDILSRDKIGLETIYTVKDEDRVAKVVVAHKTSILDKLVDITLTTWLETFTKENLKKTKSTS